MIQENNLPMNKEKMPTQEPKKNGVDVFIEVTDHDHDKTYRSR